MCTKCIDPIYEKNACKNLSFHHFWEEHFLDKISLHFEYENNEQYFIAARGWLKSDYKMNCRQMRWDNYLIFLVLQTHRLSHTVWKMKTILLLILLLTMNNTQANYLYDIELAGEWMYRIES